MVLVVATLIGVDEVSDVIRTEPLFGLLNDEDVFLFWHKTSVLSALSATVALLCTSDSSFSKCD